MKKNDKFRNKYQIMLKFNQQKSNYWNGKNLTDKIE